MMLPVLVALMLLTLPLWLIPALLVVGWVEAGRDIIRDLPAMFRLVVRGKRR